MQTHRGGNMEERRTAVGSLRWSEGNIGCRHLIAGDSLMEESRALEGGGGEIYGAAMHDRRQRRMGSIFRPFSIWIPHSVRLRSAIEHGESVRPLERIEDGTKPRNGVYWDLEGHL